MLSEKMILMEAEWVDEEKRNCNFTLIKEVVNFAHSKQCLGDWEDRLSKEIPSKKIVRCAYYEKKETLI